ncbi:hypothetical protein SAMN05443572_106165 [Myxococcus fulvus]|uniref:Lipoprotein n=1 Tax=Myxococcus fulvus TaxID=33 RepID=A0ABY1CLQ7_MYXFU|nr:hypothetical protein SAMN05443572_106165 [Myxococcus fulvus]
MIRSWRVWLAVSVCSVRGNGFMFSLSGGGR